MLFGFYRTKSFPVDTWIEKIYIENFNGTLKDRTKIKDYFISEFSDYSGYIQQYLFYYKRSLESKE
jgi:N-glycosylase/DNA lyase